MEEKKEPRTRTITCVKFEHYYKYDLKEFTKNLMNEYKGSINILAIRHEKDTKINENGEIEQVKPHWHYYLEAKNPKRVSTWSKIMDIEENIVKFVKSKNGAINYLTHRLEQDKVKYDSKNILSNYKKYEELIEDMEISNAEIYKQIRNNGNDTILKYIDRIELTRLKNINYLVGSQRLIKAENERNLYYQITNKYLSFLKFIKNLDFNEEIKTSEQWKEEIIKRVLFEEEEIATLDSLFEYFYTRKK